MNVKYSEQNHDASFGQLWGDASFQQWFRHSISKCLRCHMSNILDDFGFLQGVYWVNPIVS